MREERNERESRYLSRIAAAVSLGEPAYARQTSGIRPNSRRKVREASADRSRGPGRLLPKHSDAAGGHVRVAFSHWAAWPKQSGDWIAITE